MTWVWLQVFPETYTWILCLIYSTMAALCVDVAIQAWTQGTTYEARILRG